MSALNTQESIIAKFDAGQLAYIAQSPAGLWKDTQKNKHRKRHLYLICFAFDNKFHSDIRSGYVGTK